MYNPGTSSTFPLRFCRLPITSTDIAILKGFKKCGDIGYDGDVNSLHSRLRDTIVNREIPPEVLAEVNEFLIQLEAERNETGGNLDESFESEEDDNDKDTEEKKMMILRRMM